MRCEEDLLCGLKLNEALDAFILDFNGKSDLTNPTKYENSKDHWYKQGVWIPVPWEHAKSDYVVNEVEKYWVRFKEKTKAEKDTPIFSQYLNGANAFYQYLLDRLTPGEAI
jgi:hypothetical protein